MNAEYSPLAREMWIEHALVMSKNSNRTQVSELGGQESCFFVPQPICAKIKDHGMETAFKPGEKSAQVTLLRPHGGVTVPANELFLEDFVDAAPQTIEYPFFTLAFRQQINCRLSSQVRERQMGAGRIHLMQPVQERLRWHHHESGSVNEFHGYGCAHAAR